MYALIPSNLQNFKADYAWIPANIRRNPPKVFVQAVLDEIFKKTFPKKKSPVEICSAEMAILIVRFEII